MKDMFSRWAQKAAGAVGSPVAFMLAAGLIVIWAVGGMAFGFTDTWQLVINTGTTIITFLMVFLIQNSQNRDSKAMHLKLDELIRSIDKARNEIIDMEEASEEDLERLQKEFQEYQKRGEPGAKSVLAAIDDAKRSRS